MALTATKLWLGSAALLLLVALCTQRSSPRANASAVHDLVEDAAREATAAGTSTVAAIRLQGAARASGMLTAVRAILGDAESENLSGVRIEDFAAHLRKLEQGALKALPDPSLTKNSYAAAGGLSR